jgi:serine/threonine-protein kinase
MKSALTDHPAMVALAGPFRDRPPTPRTPAAQGALIVQGGLVAQVDPWRSTDWATDSEEGDLPWKPGQVVAGHYEIRHLIGRGGYGAVFAATQRVSGQAVALKMLHRSHDPKGARRFEREAQVLARLQHINTVRVLDAGHDADGGMYLAMELLAGETLETLLRPQGGGRVDRVMTQADALDIAVQVLDSLTEAHAHGVVHRDIKPSNIMLVNHHGRRTVKLLDFGVATVTRAETLGAQAMTTDHVVGTPTYMSPEQCLGQPADARSDLYSLAVVLYRCLCGRLPFDEQAAVNTMYAHVHMPARDLASAAPTPLSPGFATAVMKALAKEPHQRFANAGEMRTALITGSAGSVTTMNAGVHAITSSIDSWRGADFGERHVAALWPQGQQFTWRQVAFAAALGAVLAVAAVSKGPNDQPMAGSPEPTASGTMAAPSLTPSRPAADAPGAAAAVAVAAAATATAGQRLAPTADTTVHGAPDATRAARPAAKRKAPAPRGGDSAAAPPIVDPAATLPPD